MLSKLKHSFRTIVPITLVFPNPSVQTIRKIVYKPANDHRRLCKIGTTTIASTLIGTTTMGSTAIRSTTIGAITMTMTTIATTTIATATIGTNSIRKTAIATITFTTTTCMSQKPKKGAFNIAWLK